VKDVYKLGHAGDVKKVADGYGRNFLLPQGLAVLATPGALKTIDKIQAKATIERAQLNQEMSGIAEQLSNVELQFISKAGETGKLYGSITSQMVVDELNAQLGTSFSKHQIDIDPIRTLGEHPATIRLTVDLNPKIKIIVKREGESVKVTAKKSEVEKETSVDASLEEVKPAEAVEVVVDTTDSEETAAEVAEVVVDTTDSEDTVVEPAE
jgi:large subunit ribosomal protein L9